MVSKRRLGLGITLGLAGLLFAVRARARATARARARARIKVTIALATAVLGGACGSEDPLAPTASLEVTPSALDFGSVAMGERVTRVLRMSNLGSSPLTICLPLLPQEGCGSPSSIGKSLGFEWPNSDMSWTLAAGETKTFTVSFSPTSSGVLTSSLKIGHTGANGSTEISLLGDGRSPPVRIEPTNVDFGSVALNHRNERALTIFNQSNPPLPIDLRFASRLAAVFGVKRVDGTELSPSDVLTLPANDSLSVVVWFAPKEMGEFTSTVDVSTCAAGCSLPVGLHGTGIKPEAIFDPADPVDFGTHAAGTPVERVVRVKSTGASVLTLMGLDFGATSTGEFTENNSFPVQLMPGSIHELKIQHVGATPGADDVLMKLVSDAIVAPEIQLKGLSMGPEIVADPPGINFGSHPPSGGPLRKNLKIRNDGNEDLRVSTLAITGSDEFSIATPPTLPKTIVPNGIETIAIDFSPRSNGQKSASVTIGSNDYDEGTLTVPLVGVGGSASGCSIVAAPFVLDFGVVAPGGNLVLPIEIRNVGDADCALQGAQVSGEPFALETSVPATTLPPSTILAAAVSYSPAGAASHTGTLTISLSSGDIAVSLKGTGATVGLRVVPNPLDLGVANPNCYAPTASLRLHNDSESRIDIERIRFDVTSSSEFSVSFDGATQGRLEPAEFVHVPVRYKPQDQGNDFGVLYVDYNCSSGCAPGTLAVATLGRGQSGSVSEVFEQEKPSAVDILFVVEITGLTLNERIKLSDAFQNAFIAPLNAAEVDYRIAAVSMNPGPDSAGFAGGGKFLQKSTRIITPSTPEAGEAFRDNIGGENVYGFEWPVNDYGLEKALKSALLALTEPNLSYANSGFLRPDVPLSVIFMTRDEGNSGQLDALEDFLAGYKDGRGRMTRLNAIVSRTNPECNGGDVGYGRYAPRFIALTDATGGLAASICASKSDVLNALVPYAAGKSRRFPLGGKPEGAITVKVDANAASTLDWEHKTTDNSILFHESAVPNFGATIEVTYTPQCIEN